MREEQALRKVQTMEEEIGIIKDEKKDLEIEMQVIRKNYKDLVIDKQELDV